MELFVGVWVPAASVVALFGGLWGVVSGPEVEGGRVPSVVSVEAVLQRASAPAGAGDCGRLVPALFTSTHLWGF